MSVNCIRCGKKERIGLHLKCGECVARDGFALFAAAEFRKSVAVHNRRSSTAIAVATDEQAVKWQEADAISRKAWASVFGTAPIPSLDVLLEMEGTP